MSDTDSNPTPRPAGDRTRSRASRPRKQRALWLKVALRTMLGFFLLGMLGLIALVVMYLRTDIPQPNADAAKQVSIVYYSDGKTELDRFSSVNRDPVELSQVPLPVQRAFLAAEDRNFYKNNGVSVTGIVRALWTNLRGGQQQGGSTITQQYVKNYFLTQDKTVSRKLKEVMIAVKIDRRYSKDEILKNYLNNTYFGRNAWGIQAASQTYFKKDVSKLTLAEGAFLALVINAPSFLDPANGPRSQAAVNGRMTYVLDGMVQMGWMSQQVRDQQKFPVVKPREAPTYGSGPTGYITAAVRQELRSKLQLSDEDIERGGLRITTTIEKPSQDAAVKAVQDNVPEGGTTQLHAGLVAQKPDGAIVAMYGGRDYRKTQYNSATQAAPQGGSTFKAFGLIAALENGYSLNSRFSGSSPMYLPGLKKPLANAHGTSYGVVSLRTAMQKSINTSFLRLNQEMGPAKVRAAAIKAGIPETSPGLGDDTTNILGTASSRVTDMARSYSTISSAGKRADQYLIRSVKSTVGDYSYSVKPKTEQTIDKEVAADVTNALAAVNKPGGTAYDTLRRNDFTRPSAGKTGTTDRFRAAWYVGFTPNQLTTAVGMYAGSGSDNDTLAKEGEEFYGGEVPAAIWAQFMDAALRGQDEVDLPEAANVRGKQPRTTYVPPPATTRARPTAPVTTTTTSSTSTATTTTSSTSSSTTSSPSTTRSSSTTSAPPSTTQPPATTQPPTTTPPPVTTPPAPTTTQAPAPAQPQVTTAAP